MVDHSQTHPSPLARRPVQELYDSSRVPFDKRKLTYAGSFTNPVQSTIIRAMEWCTGKVPMLRRIRRFERIGPATGQKFWKQARAIMEIDLLTPREEIERIPSTGPVIIVANHPHGLIDGMMLAELVGEVRDDYKILTRSLLTGVEEVSKYMIPVPFPDEDEAFEKSLEMRKSAMSHLADGGAIVVFPSGSVAASETMFGPAVEAEWNPFTAKMIQRSRAVVVPVKFPGQNSRLYQMANQVSATLRQGLLIREVAKAFGKPQRPIIGEPIADDLLKEKGKNSRDFMAWLREHTLALRA
ncbi:MAG: lysophospholipid acyltransferase family protein [Pseudomonadota bacterium]